MDQNKKCKHDVFISYSTKNKNVADAIVADFEGNGIKCWYAPRDILPGEEWVTAITNALESSRVLVLVYTEESNSSRQVMNEIALAFNAGLTIVPFRLSEEQMSSELEYYLTRVHWLDALTKPLKQNIISLREYLDIILKAKTEAMSQKTSEDVQENESETDNKESKKKHNRKHITIISALAAGLVIICIPIILHVHGRAAAGERHNMKILGDKYYDGIGVEMNEEEAIDYYLKAIDFSDSGSIKIKADPLSSDMENAQMLNRIGLFFYAEGDYETAGFFFTESLKYKEDVTVMANAGMAFENAENREKAIKWYSKAIEAGHRDSDKFEEKIRMMNNN